MKRAKRLRLKREALKRKVQAAPAPDATAGVAGVLKVWVNGKAATVRPLPKDHKLDPNAGLALWLPKKKESE
jgi:hypothetical protein